MGFEIGSHQNINEITTDDWKGFASDIGMPEEWVLNEKEGMINTIRENVPLLKGTLPPAMANVLQEIVEDAEPRLR